MVMALEGGYDLDSTAKSVLACIEVLLQKKPILGTSEAEANPSESTWRVKCVKLFLDIEMCYSFWDIVKRK